MEGKTIYFIIGGLVFFGTLAYWSALPKAPKPPDDPKAVEALTLVKTHISRQGSTIEEAILDLVDHMEAQGQSLRLGHWRVASSGTDSYVVSILIREKGFSEWIERDYAWRVNLKDKSIRVITLPAMHLMPLHELPPLPHSQEISFLPPRMLSELRPG